MPAGAQAHLAGVGIAVHVRHELPRLVAALGNVELVASEEVRRGLVVVDGLRVLPEEPGERESLVRERLRPPHRRDALALPVGVEAERHPLNHGLVSGIAREEPEAFHVLALVRVRAGEQQLPAPELRIEGLLDPCRMRLEGLRHTLVALSEADAERAEDEPSLGPLRRRLREPLEDRVLDLSALLLGSLAEPLERLVDRELEGVLVCELHLLMEELGDECRVAWATDPVRVLGRDPRLGKSAEGGRKFAETDLDKACHGGIASCFVADVPAPGESRFVRSCR